MADKDRIDNIEQLEELEDEDLEESIITLVDDEGNETDFELLDTITYNDNDYVILCSTEEGEAGSEAVVLRIVDDPDDEESFDLEPPDTEEEGDAVYELFRKQYKDVIDFLD